MRNYNMEIEQWKDIKGYEGLYMISNLGRTWSNVTNKILKLYCSSNGYEHVNLTKNGKSKYHITHRLVAEAFVDNPYDYPCVNHIDEDIRNNAYNNLEWCTQKYNSNYGTRIKRITKSIDYDSVSKKNSIAVLQCDTEGNVIKEWVSSKECARVTGYDNSNIIKCCRGKSKTAYGYVWKYKESI